MVTWNPQEGMHHMCAFCSDTGLSFLDLLSSVMGIVVENGIKATIDEGMPVQDATSVDEPGFFLNGFSLENLLRECDHAQFLCHSSACERYAPAVKISLDDSGVRCIQAPELLFPKSYPPGPR